MKPVVIHPEAEREMLAAALFYEERCPGLGRLFLDVVERGFRRIVERPEVNNLQVASAFLGVLCGGNDLL